MSIPRRYPRTFLAFLLTLALLAPTLALAPPARAADPCVVTSEEDDGPGTLRVAVDTVANGGCAGGTVTFATGVTEIRLSNLLRINRALTIQGPGMGVLTLRYTGASSVSGNVITITVGPTVLRDLTIADGKVAGSYYGGGVRIAPSAAHVVDVTLERVRVAGNASVGSGGGIYATNATLQVTNSKIEGNQAGQDGGGLYLSNLTGPVTATLTNTVVNGNSAGAYGGGIAANDAGEGSGPAVQLVDTTVSGNHASGRGGGLTVYVGTLTLTRSTIHGNTSGSEGGAFYTEVSTVTVTDSTISGNNAGTRGGGAVLSGKTATVVNSTITGNTAQADGGGLYYQFGTFDLTNSTVSGNETSHSGGGVVNNAGTVNLSAVTLVGNRAANAGGGLYAIADEEASATTTIARSILAGNLRAGNPQNCATLSTTRAPLTSQGDNLVGNATGCPTNGPGDLTLTAALTAVFDPALADNGGPTKTHNLVPGSLAADRIPSDRCGVTTDQRGFPRPQDDPTAPGSGCDIGAVEYTSAPPSPAPSPSPSTVPSPSPSTGPCGTRFGDVPAADPACVAIEALAGRGVIKGCDQAAAPPLFCPTAPTLRAQMAALIVRAMAWGSETPANPFTDQCDPQNPANCIDGELWNAVGILGAKNVAKGYTDGATCAPAAAPCYAPRDNVLFAQTISFITRAMVQKGYWTQATTDDGSVYPNIPQASGHRLDFVTYVANVGPVPGTASATQDFAAWDQPSTRAWFAQALWQVLQGH